MTTHDRLTKRTNDAHKLKCDRLRERLLAYRFIHPVTVRGVCRFAGIEHHQTVSSWFSGFTRSLPDDAVERVDRFLKARNF